MELTAIYDIGRNWGMVYDLAFDGKTWTAERKGEPQHTLIASTEAELVALIRQDYFSWKGA